MNEKFNESTRNRPEGERVLDAPLVTIDLANYLQQIKTEEAWFRNDRNAITVFKTHNVSIVLVALHANAEIKPPLASDGITIVQVMDGEINFFTDAQSVQLNKGVLLTLHENIFYTATAITETILLLTVTDQKKSVL